jgi:hypothetical protein
MRTRLRQRDPDEAESQRSSQTPPTTTTATTNRIAANWPTTSALAR